MVAVPTLVVALSAESAAASMVYTVGILACDSGARGRYGEDMMVDTDISIDRKRVGKRVACNVAAMDGRLCGVRMVSVERRASSVERRAL